MAYSFIRRIGEVELDGGFGGGRGGGERSVCLLVGGEQCFETCAQPFVIAALAVELRRALGVGFRQRKLE